MPRDIENLELNALTGEGGKPNGYRFPTITWPNCKKFKMSRW